MAKLDRSDITPEPLYLSRRRFIKGLGAAVTGALALAACGPQAAPATQSAAPPATPDQGASTPLPTADIPPLPTLSAQQDDLGDPLTTYQAINTYNNYYEFSLSKEAVADLSQDFETTPWQVEVGGLVNKPRTFDLEDLFQFTQQERIYRMRCVEAWSMVIPWIGFPLSELLQEVEPTAEAQFVRFETAYKPAQMPGVGNKTFPWPYVEGLRLDEAMHDLTILATGLYGKPLRPQTGAPVRLVVPWKYGFKSIKSVVKIELVAEMPATFWNTMAAHEYGFYANVNPDVPHPRWSQASERRIGETKRRKTMMFNGYEQEVAQLYEGMDLTVWF